MSEPRPPFPPFDAQSAAAKVQAAEDAWNSRDPRRVSLAYTEADRRIHGPRPDDERGRDIPLH